MFTTPPPEGIVEWYRKGVPGGGQKDPVFQRLKAKLTGGKYDGIGYFSFLEEKLSSGDGDIIINNMKKDPDGYPMFQTGSTSGADEARYQKWIVERYLLKESFTESFTDTTVVNEEVEEEKEETIEEEAEKIVDEAEKEVKEDIDEAVEVVNEEVVNNPIVELPIPQFKAQKTAPDLSDIVNLLPPNLLAAVNQETGQDYEKTTKAKKKVETISNAKILKTMTASFEKIQGQLSSIDNELKKQNELLGAAVGTTVSNLNQIETTYDSLNDRFDDILIAFQSDYEAEKKRIDDEETAASMDAQDDQDDMAGTGGYEDTTDPLEKLKKKGRGGGGLGLLRNALRLLKFFRGGGVKKFMRRMRNPLKTGRALLRKSRMGITSNLRKIPGGKQISGGIQRATQFLRGGAANKTARAATQAVGRKAAVKTGAKVGSRFIPGVGIAVGGALAAERFSKGDTMGGLLAAGGMIPGPVGWAFLAAELGLLPAAEAIGNHTRMLKKKKQAEMLVQTGNDLTPEEQEAFMYGEQKSTPEELEAREEYTEKVARGEDELVTPEIKQYTPSFIEKITPGGTFFGKFEQGGSGYGTPELHGTEALIEPGFYKDLISPLGGMILSASSKVLSDAGPLAKAVAPTFQQEASKLASVFDVPTSVASTNVGGSVDAAANAINKATRVDSPAAAAAAAGSSVEGGNVAEEKDAKRKGPLEFIGGLFNRLGNLFRGNRNQNNRNNNPGNYSGQSFSTTGGAKVTNANISRGFGVRDDLGSGRSATGHTGLDIAGVGFEENTPISILPPGEVIDVGLMGDASDPGGPGGTQGGYGNFAVIKLDNGGVVKMSHFNQVNVSKGQRVGKQSDGKFPVIGKLGNTGLSTGPHLHLDLGTGYNSGSARVTGLEDPMPHIADLIRGGGNFAKGGLVGLKGEEQITVGEEGPEIVMKNLVHGTPPVLDHLMAMNDAGTSSELIQTYRTFAPEVLEYDEESESMAQTILVMTPPVQIGERAVDMPRDRSITRPPRSVAPAKAALHIALYS